jgi:hypothetical protein
MGKMWIGALVVLALSSLLGACEATAQTRDELLARQLSNEDFDLQQRGTCTSDAGQTIDLATMMILEDTWLDVEDGASRKRLRVRGQRFSIEDLTGRSADGRLPVRSIFVPLVLRNAEDVDVEVRLAFVDDQLAVFWRETFQHRRYRQGLLRVVDDGLQHWCEGVGGLDEAP